MSVEVEEIRRRMVSLPDEELLGIVTSHSGEYREIARTTATQELARRGISFATPTERPSSFPNAQITSAVSDEQKKTGWETYVIVGLAGILCIILSLWVGAYLAVLYDDNVQSKYLRRVVKGFGIAFLLLLWELKKRSEAKKGKNDLQVRAQQDIEQPHD
jgi:hypothetical protein